MMPDDVEQVIERHAEAELLTSIGLDPSAVLNMPARSSAGNARIDEAKITGMTPPVLTFSGMCVLDPPYIRRPTTRLAYCTVTRRCPRSTKMIAADDARHQDEQDEHLDQPELAGFASGRSSESTARGKPTTIPA